MSSDTVDARAGVSHSVESRPKRRRFKSLFTRRKDVFSRGVLNIQIYGARGIKGYRFGTASPYMTVKHGTAHRKVTLSSRTHHKGGSNPVWNAEFKFPLRNGGTKDHNIVEIEIWNENTHSCFLRADNSLGHVRIGGLAKWITQHSSCITGPTWYPVFYKRRQSSKDQSEGDQRGQILMQFTFEAVKEKRFKKGQRTEPSYSDLSTHSAVSLASDPSIPAARYDRVEGSTLSGIFGSLGPAIGIAQTMLMIL